MLSHLGKIQATTIADNIRTGDISLSKDKIILKGIKEMSILQKDKSLKDNSLSKDKHLPSEDNSSPKNKLLSKGANSDHILFFPKEKTENTTINASSFILSDIERKYLNFSKFIYNNPNGPGYCQTSTESIYPRIIITEKIDPIFIQNAMDFGIIDRIYLSYDCMEILNDTLITQLYQRTRTQNYYARFLIRYAVGYPESTKFIPNSSYCCSIATAV